MRRRVWWEVFYYDLFISDSLGLAPLIADDQHTCRLPVKVDDEAFTPKSSVLPLLSPVSVLESDVVGTGSSGGGVSFGGMGYFIQKSCLAQLVKNMKKLSSPSSSFAHQHHQLSSPMTSSHPNPSHPSSHSTPEAGTLEAATKAENDVHAFLADLPEGWKLDVDLFENPSTYPSYSSSKPHSPAHPHPHTYSTNNASSNSHAHPTSTPNPDSQRGLAHFLWEKARKHIINM
ncbi:hypothetical protein M422DRAFT_258065 [Sphaerobolus stellatus SS14]|uniref:Xylanolytic transcriptional activator regulatory domain-containing protein n=1 Tax=Sphaerobolus stellatus (strain SS14) TaxID=990650 RepID=A0A0C9UWC0_SPHS4|nr:hypothetical protein M422DRAFT_258065 [Sphaerobolus stellatus SS14]